MSARVSHGTRGTADAGVRLCSSCQANPARAKQRTCPDCHARLMRTYRKRQRAQQRDLAWELRELRKGRS